MDNTSEDKILTPESIRFLNQLAQEFEPRRQELLRRRRDRQQEIDNGSLPDFLENTGHIRQNSWTVAAIPRDLVDRRVEITGPVDRKMIINALNSGANVFMADFEDSTSPTWENVIEGQANLRDAVNGSISFISPDNKRYQLSSSLATLMVRPRGWHLRERHFLVGDKSISAALFDFGLYLFHNAEALINKGTAPYFYLPKIESHLEARLWNDVFCFSQDELRIPRGTIRATVLIETVLAAFEMNEVLYELRDHSAGLNCGRWDYIFSFIKKFRNRPDFVLPDRSTITMEKHFLKSYADLLIHTCHRRGIHAIGGMAAQIPIKNNPAANEKAFQKVREDKLREARAGHDGTWVAHPGLVQIAKEAFDSYMKEPNQISKKRSDVYVTSKDLLAVPDGHKTMEGVRWNVDVSLQYLSSWLGGSGCVPIYDLMEDTATAEICRTQVWQWVHHQTVLVDGTSVTRELVHALIAEHSAKLSGKHVQEAAKILAEMMTSPRLDEFLTLSVKDYLH